MKIGFPKKSNRLGLALVAVGCVLIVFAAIYFGYAMAAEARLARLPMDTPGTVPADDLNKILQEKIGATAQPATRPVGEPVSPAAPTTAPQTIAQPTAQKPATPQAVQRPGGPFWYLPENPARPINQLSQFPGGTRIVLPTLGNWGVTSDLVEVDWEPEEGDLNWVIGHVKETPNPGQPGRMALLGHKSSPVTNQGAILRELINIKLGDPIVVQTANNWYLYTVTDKFILPKEEVKMGEIFAPTDKQLLTLITCEPEYVYTHRLFVTATLHPYWLQGSPITRDEAETAASSAP